MSDAFQILEDCPDCGVEGAVVGLVDPLQAEGVAVVASCRLCGRKELGGKLKRAGRAFSTPEQVVVALRRWAQAEGTDDVDEFCAANMSGLSPREVGALVVAGQPVATSFDVIAFLFPGMGAGAGPNLGDGFDPYEPARSMDVLPGGWPTAAPPPAPDALPVGWPEPRLPDALPDGWPEARPPAPPPVDPRRTPVRALAAVMLADGIASKGERQFLERFCAAARLAPPTAEDLRAWRPGELPPPDDANIVVDAMVELAHLDRQQDGSEWRVVREFARAWGLDLAALEKRRKQIAPRGPQMGRLFTALSRLFLDPTAGPGAP